MEKANKKGAAQGKSQTTAVERKPRSVSKSVDKKAAGAKKDQSKGRRSTSKGKQAEQPKKGAQDKKAADKRKSSKSQKRDASKKKSGKEVTAAEEDNTMKPTRPLSTYIYYSNETVPKLKKESGLDHRAAMSKAGELWNKLSDSERKKFDELHAKDVIRYENQKKELKEKGYFMLEDGTKSSDHQVQGKKKATKSAKKEAKSAVKKRGSAAAAAATEPKKAATAKKPVGKKGKLNQSVDEDEQHSKVEESD